eukprot:8531652-Ditylum_brightwellii.AAC.1
MVKKYDKTIQKGLMKWHKIDTHDGDRSSLQSSGLISSVEHSVGWGKGLGIMFRDLPLVLRNTCMHVDLIVLHLSTIF